MNSYIATSRRRIFAKMIDFVLIAVVVGMMALGHELVGSDEIVFISLDKYLMTIFFIPFLYDLLFLYLIQSTPGKWLMQLRVVPLGNLGGQLSFTHVFLRSLSEHLLVVIGFGFYLTAYFRYDRRHWGDLLSETIVVQEVPRLTRVQVYPFLASIVFLIYTYAGLISFYEVSERIDWRNRRIQVMSDQLFDQIFEMEDDLISQ